MAKKKISEVKRGADVAIIMGSDSDLPVMRDAAAALDHFDISYDMAVISAHRTPREMADFASTASERGLKVIIAGAGGAAHLPGMVAAYTELPVIGVPVPIGHLSGQDALFSIVQMPKGVPVATVAIGNAWNAGILAVQMLAATHPALHKALRDYKEELRQRVFKKNESL